MKKIMTVLVELLRPTGKTNTASARPAPPIAATVADDIQFCNHPRHGAFPPRRKLLDTGVSTHGLHYVVFQCPACGDFVARVLNRTAGTERVLFRGRNYSPRRESPQRTSFHPIRSANSDA